jgi:hypothetical protein
MVMKNRFPTAPHYIPYDHTAIYFISPHTFLHSFITSKTPYSSKHLTQNHRWTYPNTSSIHICIDLLITFLRSPNFTKSPYYIYYSLCYYTIYPFWGTGLCLAHSLYHHFLFIAPLHLLYYRGLHKTELLLFSQGADQLSCLVFMMVATPTAACSPVVGFVFLVRNYLNPMIFPTA